MRVCANEEKNSKCRRRHDALSLSLSQNGENSIFPPAQSAASVKSPERHERLTDIATAAAVFANIAHPPIYWRAREPATGIWAAFRPRGGAQCSATLRPTAHLVGGCVCEPHLRDIRAIVDCRRLCPRLSLCGRRMFTTATTIDDGGDFDTHTHTRTLAQRQ